MKVFDIIIVAESRKYRETGQGWSSLVLFVVYLVMKKKKRLACNERIETNEKSTV